MSRAISENFEDDVHGGADPQELGQLGLHPDEVLDFSANLNPFGPSPAVRLAVSRAAIDRYPDRACRELRHELARRHGVGMEQVLAGNGSSELIWLAAVADVAPGDRVAVLGPTFGEYERSARRMGADVVTYLANPEDGFCPPVIAFAKGVRERQAKLAFLANPNNPTGRTVELDCIVALATDNPQTLFVLDEAYADCVDGSQQSIPEPPPNVLRLRSLAKVHGLAGVRLGYAVGAVDVIAKLRAAQPAWSVNALAQAAGLAALGDERHVRDCLAKWNEAKAELIDQLRNVGFAPVPSAAPFFLLWVGDASRTRSQLLRRGVVVRDCTSFGLPEYVRVSSRQREENSRFVEALRETRAEVRPCNS